MEDQNRESSQDDVISKGVMTDAIEVDANKSKAIKENLEKYEQLFGADEDAFEQPTTTRKELWSYYLYYNVSGMICLLQASQLSQPRGRPIVSDYRRVTMVLDPDHTRRRSSNLP